MRKMQKHFSNGVLISISPYPTVVIVVIVKYIEVKYYSLGGIIAISPSIHVPSPANFVSAFVSWNYAAMTQRHATICTKRGHANIMDPSLSKPTPTVT
jgi:hypothetical protein